MRYSLSPAMTAPAETSACGPEPSGQSAAVREDSAAYMQVDVAAAKL